MFATILRWPVTPLPRALIAQRIGLPPLFFGLERSPHQSEIRKKIDKTVKSMKFIIEKSGLLDFELDIALFSSVFCYGMILHDAVSGKHGSSPYL